MKFSDLSHNNTPKTAIEQRLHDIKELQHSQPQSAYEIIHSEFKDISLDDIPIYLILLELKSQNSWFTGHFQESYMYAQELLDISKSHDNDYYQSSAYMLLGNIHLHMNNFDEALFEYNTGLKLARTSQNTEIEQSILNRIGQIYAQLKSYELALEQHEKALEIATLNNQPHGMGISHFHMGKISYAKKDYIEAYKHLDNSLDIFIKNNNKLGETIALLGKAAILIDEKEYDSAEELLLYVQQLQNDIGDLDGNITTNIKMAKLYFKKNQIHKAKQIAINTLHNKSFNIPDIKKSQLLFLLSEIYEQNQNYEEALLYYKRHHVCESELDEKRTKERLNSLRIQIQMEQANHEKEMFRIKNVKLHSENKELNLLYESINTIAEIGQDITSTLNIQDVLLRVYKNINHIMSATSLGIILYNQEDGTLEYPMFITNDKLMNYPSKKIDSKNSLSSLCIKNRMDILINDYRAEYQNYENITSELASIPSSQSMLYVPLEFNKEILGAVSVQSNHKNVYSKKDLNTLKALASYIAIAILNAQKSQKLEEELQQREEDQHELEVLNKRLREMSYIDVLTQIPNRRHFVDMLNNELNRAKRKQTPLSIIIIDIDKFKEYNDNYGHTEGDSCIQRVAHILQTSLKRRTDFVARYGGDEFVMILPDTELEGAMYIAEQLRSNVENENIKHEFSKIAPYVTITLGVYSGIPDEKTTLEKAVHLADSSLYAAKAMGRNKIAGNVSVYSE